MFRSLYKQRIFFGISIDLKTQERKKPIDRTISHASHISRINRHTHTHSHRSDERERGRGRITCLQTHTWTHLTTGSILLRECVCNKIHSRIIRNEGIWIDTSKYIIRIKLTFKDEITLYILYTFGSAELMCAEVINIMHVMIVLVLVLEPNGGYGYWLSMIFTQ